MCDSQNGKDSTRAVPFSFVNSAAHVDSAKRTFSADLPASKGCPNLSVRYGATRDMYKL